ncbi:30S ribosomal protein S3 [Candidatus Peregrinibacteria bacterium CG08_land_8_20_14_0_20_41_10]|nr:MAG: 30S ribosomal protein S3 [Candidatus Peregrinibacteria bacterium CG1_02_41_10]PIS32266.1 MAG: 30S ribosomal protein S3 [Candidatus Peregrinibacteria bacterium CG08_land_8_20_14_0_20_41_10]
MGKKVNPNIIRLGINKSWHSNWFAEKKKYAAFLHQDLVIRDFLMTTLKEAGIAKIYLERFPGKVVVNIYTAKPGVIIGRSGENIENLRLKLKERFKEQFEVNILEVEGINGSAKLVGESIAAQIVRRVPYRRAVKNALEKIQEEKKKIEGAKVLVSGRLNGAEIARSEYFVWGKIPLHTLRSDIDYELVKALTTYGIIGIKTWIYKGQLFKEEPMATRNPKSKPMSS